MLQEATEKLKHALNKHADILAPVSNVDNAELENAVKAPGADAFGSFIASVLKIQSQDSNSIRHKANAFMKKMYPVASFALSIVSIGSTVSCRRNTQMSPGDLLG
jgi:hypothetical protein